MKDSMKPNMKIFDSMKHKIIYSVALLLAAVSCKESVPVSFGDMAGVYFNNRASGNILTDRTEVTFVYHDGDEMEVPVAVQLIGRPSDRDRKVSIRATSDNAVEGTDYTLPEDAVLPAGETELSYIVTLKKTESINTEAKSVDFEILANDEFELPVKEIKYTTGSVTTLRYRIVFSNRFTKAPAAWDRNLLGEFSLQKFELILKKSDITYVTNRSDFNDTSKMGLSRQQFVSSVMRKYVNEEVAKRQSGEEYDEDCFDSLGNPLEFYYVEE